MRVLGGPLIFFLSFIIFFEKKIDNISFISINSGYCDG